MRHRKLGCVSKPDCVLLRTPGCDLGPGPRFTAPRVPVTWLQGTTGECPAGDAQCIMQNAQCTIGFPRMKGASQNDIQVMIA